MYCEACAGILFNDTAIFAAKKRRPTVLPMYRMFLLQGLTE